MPTKTSAVQADLDDLQASIDEAVELLEAVNTVTATREDLAQAVLDALDALAEDDDSDSDDDTDPD